MGSSGLETAIASLAQTAIDGATPPSKPRPSWAAAGWRRAVYLWGPLLVVVTGLELLTPDAQPGQKAPPTTQPTSGVRIAATEAAPSP